MALSPLQYADLPDIDDIAPIGPDDQACLDELQEVLSRHGRLGRFGVTLLHRHFDLAPDEVLVETVDKSKRTLTTRPRTATQAGSAIETHWRFDEFRNQRCEVQCMRIEGPNGQFIHDRPHYTTSHL